MSEDKKWCEQCEKFPICTIHQIRLKTLPFTKIRDSSVIAEQCALWKQIPWDDI